MYLFNIINVRINRSREKYLLELGRNSIKNNLAQTQIKIFK